MKGQLCQVIDQIDLNLPPGTITKAAKKLGLTGQVEQQVLTMIYEKLQSNQENAIERLDAANIQPSEYPIDASNRESIDPKFGQNATDKSLKMTPGAKENDDILSISPQGQQQKIKISEFDESQMQRHTHSKQKENEQDQPADSSDQKPSQGYGLTPQKLAMFNSSSLL